MKQFLFLVAALCLGFTSMTMAATPKKKSAAPKKTSSSPPAARTSAKPATGKTAHSTSGKHRGVSSRASAPARPRSQTAPTPERYREIQQALADKGYYTGAIDGNWNGECVSALKRFQQDQNLTADGKLGALSLIALGLGPKREPLPPVSQFLAKPDSAGSTVE